MINNVKEEARSLRVISEKKRESSRRQMQDKLALVEGELNKLKDRVVEVDSNANTLMTNTSCLPPLYLQHPQSYSRQNVAPPSRFNNSIKSKRLFKRISEHTKPNSSLSSSIATPIYPTLAKRTARKLQRLQKQPSNLGYSRYLNLSSAHSPPYMPFSQKLEFPNIQTNSGYYQNPTFAPPVNVVAVHPWQSSAAHGNRKFDNTTHLNTRVSELISDNKNRDTTASIHKEKALANNTRDQRHSLSGEKRAKEKILKTANVNSKHAISHEIHANAETNHDINPKLKTEVHSGLENKSPLFYRRNNESIRPTKSSKIGENKR